MRIIMRIFFLMCILGASLTIAAQNIIYGVIKMSREL